MPSAASVTAWRSTGDRSQDGPIICTTEDFVFCYPSTSLPSPSSDFSAVLAGEAQESAVWPVDGPAGWEGRKQCCSRLFLLFSEKNHNENTRFRDCRTSCESHNLSRCESKLQGAACRCEIEKVLLVVPSMCRLVLPLAPMRFDLCRAKPTCRVPARINFASALLYLP